MNAFTEGLVIVLLLIGSGFLLVGSIGLSRLPDFFMRLHAPTKASTLGIGGVLIASGLYFSLKTGRLSIHELVITLFLFITAPLTAHMMSKAALHLQRNPVERTQNTELMSRARGRNPADQADE